MTAPNVSSPASPSPAASSGLKSRLRICVAATALAVGSSGCLGLELLGCCLNCALSNASMPMDGAFNDKDEQHPEFIAKMKAMKNANGVRY